MSVALKENNIEATYNFPIFSKYGYVADFLVGKKIIVECDGEVWHKEGNEHDRKRDMVLKKLGYKVLRFKGEQIKNNIMKCIEMIKEEVKNETNKS
jgi:very-short-patch-repair endonuclease